MAKAFGEAFATIIKDGLNFQNFFKSLLQGMVNAVATLIGGVMTTAFKSLFDNLKKGFESTFFGAVKASSSAFAAIKAGFIALAAGLVANSLANFLDLDGSKKAFDEYWDHIIDEARKAGKTIAEVLSAAMLKAPTTPSTGTGKHIGAGAGIELDTTLTDVGKAIEAAMKGGVAGGKSLDEAWQNLISTAQKLGQEGSAAFVALILKMREAGLTSQSLTQYILGQLDKVAPALTVLIENIGNRYEKILSKFKLPDIKGALPTIPDDLIAKFKKGMDSYAQIAMETFRAMIANGRSWMESLTAIQPAMESLRDHYKKLGLEVPGFLKPIFNALALMKIRPEVFQNLDAATTVLKAMSNAAYMSQGTFLALARSAEIFGKTMLRVKGSLNEYLKVHKLSQTQIQELLPTISQFVGVAATFGLGIPAWMKTFVTKNLPGIDWTEFRQRAADQANAGLRTVETLRDLKDVLKDRLWAGAGWVTRIVGAIQKIPGTTARATAAGYSGVVSSPTLFLAGERGPERVQIAPTRQGNMQPAIYIRPVVIPRGDKYVIEFLTDAMRHGQMRVPAGAVGGI